MRDMNGSRGITDIVSDVLHEFTTLIRKEFELARTEITNKIGMMASAAAVIALGGALVLAGVLFALQAAVELLVEAGLSPATACILVAVAILVAGFAVIYSGLARLRAANLVPERTIEQLHRDAAVAKSHLHLSPESRP
jgi:hypothetical protein